MKIAHHSVIRLLPLLAGLGLFACSSAPHKGDYAAGSDPQVAISETEGRIASAEIDQYDQLSPSHFEKAQSALKDARAKTEKHESSDKILSSANLAGNEMKIVEANGAKYAPQLSTVLGARASARAVKADTTLPEDFNSADKQLRAFGSDIEDQDFKADSEKIAKLESRYVGLELMALKNSQLGAARSLIEKARKDKAEKRTPETYSTAVVQYESAAHAIEANRRNPEGYAPAVAQSVQAAQKLNQVLKTVIQSKASETAAVQIYDQRQQLNANQATLESAAAQATLAQAKGQSDRQSIAALKGQNSQYASREALNQRIEEIKASFDPAEADVVRDGSKIILRLKSMKFSPARFELTSSSLDTLQKVKEMMGAVTITNVVIEGHTDSIGTEQKNMELSQKRAEAVKKYFVSEKTLPESQVEAKGFGYERPLTTNKTKEGRATNRRVDVVIDTTSTI